MIFFKASLISSYSANPVEIIIGSFILAHFLIKGMLFIKPEDILIAGKFNFLIILRLEKSPGVANSKIF